MLSVVALAVIAACSSGCEWPAVRPLPAKAPESEENGYEAMEAAEELRVAEEDVRDLDTAAQRGDEQPEDNSGPEPAIAARMANCFSCMHFFCRGMWQGRRTYFRLIVLLKQEQYFPPYRLTGLPPHRLTASPPYRLTALPPYRLTALPPYRLTALPPYRLTALPPSSISHIPLHRVSWPARSAVAPKPQSSDKSGSRPVLPVVLHQRWMTLFIQRECFGNHGQVVV